MIKSRLFVNVHTVINGSIKILPTIYRKSNINSVKKLYILPV